MATVSKFAMEKKKIVFNLTSSEYEVMLIKEQEDQFRLFLFELNKTTKNQFQFVTCLLAEPKRTQSLVDICEHIIEQCGGKEDFFDKFNFYNTFMVEWINLRISDRYGYVGYVRNHWIKREKTDKEGVEDWTVSDYKPE